MPDEKKEHGTIEQAGNIASRGQETQMSGCKKCGAGIYRYKKEDGSWSEWRHR